jgi:signal transduction histidine kinase
VDVNQTLSLHLSRGITLGRMLPMVADGDGDDAQPEATVDSSPTSSPQGGPAGSSGQADGAESQRPWVAMALHEMRQPLTVIGGYARLLQRRAVYDAHAVDQILGETQRLGRLVNDLLDVSRLEAGQFVLRPALVDLVAVAHKAGDEARVSIADQGPGIAAAALPHIFALFQRGEDSAAEAVEGVGLGLHITKALVEAHGGHIDVESRVGSGSTFTFTLPYRRSDPAATTGPTPGGDAG